MGDNVPGEKPKTYPESTGEMFNTAPALEGTASSRPDTPVSPHRPGNGSPGSRSQPHLHQTTGAEEVAPVEDVSQKRKGKKRRPSKKGRSATPEAAKGTHGEEDLAEEKALASEVPSGTGLQTTAEVIEDMTIPQNWAEERTAALETVGSHKTCSAVRSRGIDNYFAADLARKRMRPVLVIGCVATVFVCVVVVSLFKRPTVGKITADGKDWCTASRSCTDAREFLRSAVDSSYDPCADFYSHVCGKWTAKTRTSDGYLDELLQSLRTRIYDHLDEMKVSPDHRELSQAMSLFFKSCCDFMTRKSSLHRVIDNVVQAFGINVRTWEASTTLEDIFMEVVRMSLMAGVPSVLKVTYVAGTNVRIYVDVGSTLAALYGRRLDDTLKTYLNDIVKAVSPGSLEGGLDIPLLEERFGKIYVQAQNATFKAMPVGDFREPIPSSLWLRSINRNFPAPLLTEDAVFHVRRLETLLDALNELKALTSFQRNTYLLLLVVSNVLVHDFHARYVLNGTREQEECLRLTSRYFRPVYYDYVVEKFQPYGTVERVAAMEGYIRTIMSDRMRTSSWIPSARRTTTATAVNDVKVLTRDPKWRVQLSDTLSYRFLTNSFVRNAVLLLKAHAELHATDQLLPLSQWQFEGTLGYVPEYNVIVVTTTVLQPDAFYDDSDGRLNYATVGALLAESFFLAATDGIENFPSGDEKKADALSCYQRRIAGMLGKEASSSREVKEVVALQVALNVTFDVHRRGQEATAESDRMFFRRFCMTSCGSPSGHRRVLPGHVRCNLLLLGLQEFQKAFDCPDRLYPVPCERSLQE